MIVVLYRDWPVAVNPQSFVRKSEKLEVCDA